MKEFFHLSPVEVMLVTPHNLDEVAEWCGGSVQETESRRVSGRMDKYVLVPTPKGSYISWAFPGMFITKRLVVTLKDKPRLTYSVFRRDYFEKNYFSSPLEALESTWGRTWEDPDPPEGDTGVVVVSVGEAFLDAQRENSDVDPEPGPTLFD